MASNYVDVQWQDGPVREDGNGANGAQVEDVIQVAIDRLNELDVAPFSCWENEAALEHLKRAIEYLNERTARRIARDVEGTLIP